MSEKKKETLAKTEAENTIASMDAEGGFDVSQLKSKRTFADALKGGAWSEAFVTMDEGDVIEGYFLGRGPDTTVGGGDTEKRMCSTWLFKHSKLNCIMRILGAAKQADGSLNGVDQDLSSKPLGVYLIVEKGEQEDIGNGRRVNRFRVAVDPKVPAINIAKYVKTQALALPAPAPHAANGAPNVTPESIIS